MEKHVFIKIVNACAAEDQDMGVIDTTKPVIRKLGTIDLDLVESTPVVFKGRLYRFEYVRYPQYKPNKTGDTYFRFIDIETGGETPSFAAGYHLGSAFVEDGTIYVYGIKEWGAPDIRVFWSQDMTNWQSQTALSLPGWGVYNNSVCRGRDGYVIAIELGEPPEVVGVRFTMRFAVSDNLLDWKILGPEYVYSTDRYTACPALRFHNDYYYMIYLEEKPGPEYEEYIIRTKDILNWELSPLNPVLRASEEDKVIANSKLTKEQRSHIASAVNINNSDIDFCEFNGKTIICYSWGDQIGKEFLAEAVYDGPLSEFLEGWFPSE